MSRLKRPDFGTLAEYEAVFAASDDGLWVTDATGTTLRVNPAYERLTGFAAHELEGQHVQDLVASGKFQLSIVTEVIRTRQVVTRITRTQHGKQLLVTGRPIFDETGALWRVVCTGRDVTELLRLQRELELQSQLARYYQTELQMLQTRNEMLKNGLVSDSGKMQKIVQTAMQVARYDLPVLLTGESGVGKEVIADLIHRTSTRSAQPMIKVNCAAIPESLLEAEFFGYEKGSFTGARSTGKPGYFELAHRGTIFLDEVGELPLPLQAKLLRVLQDFKVRRVGGTESAEVDVRVIAATNQKLQERVNQGLFRSDFYYRLNVVPLEIPPLRERREDIPGLIAYYLDQFNRKHRQQKTLDAGVLDILTAYDWPGNVRELRNLIERLVVIVADPIIALNDLPAEYRERRLPGGAAPEVPDQEAAAVDEDASLRSAMQGHEARVIAAALESAGSFRGAARLLRTSHVTLMRKARQYGIVAPPR